MKNKLNILDWYVHQGHQYEFFKSNHNFYLCAANGKIPEWNEMHRPLGKNVRLISEEMANRIQFDVVIVRSPIPETRYSRFVRPWTSAIAVMQTVEPFNIPGYVRHVVWNSSVVMKNHSFSGKRNFYIPHGYDPDEFPKLNIDKNNQVLSIANLFKKRSSIMGYQLWQEINNEVGYCKVIGHGNKKIGAKRAKTFEDLINIYNKYNIYLNTTIKSAMPRGRAEAVMCGMPLVTTDNYEIKSYFKNKKNAIVSNDPLELTRGIKMLMESEQMQEDYGNMSRETAIKYFHINDFISRWQSIFGSL